MEKRTRSGQAMTELLSEIGSLTEELNNLQRSFGEEAGMSMSCWQVASAIGNESVTVPEIGRRLGRRRQTVQVAVNALIGDGLATSAPNPKNRRSPLVELTERGRKAFWDGLTVQISWVNAMADDFDDSELAAAADVMRRLRTVLAP